VAISKHIILNKSTSTSKASPLKTILNLRKPVKNTLKFYFYFYFGSTMSGESFRNGIIEKSLQNRPLTQIYLRSQGLKPLQKPCTINLAQRRIRKIVISQN